MKNIVVRSMAAVLLVCLTACSSAARPQGEPHQASIAPYELTERETELLQALGLKDRTGIMAYNPPEGAKSAAVKVYRLKEDGTWDTGTGAALGFEASESGALRDGLFTMILGENYSIEFHISHDGSRMSSKSDEIILDTESIASTTGFLENAAEIELNQEIPVAFMVYDSGGHMPGASVENFFDPSDFQGMDLVQAVTLTFSDEI